MVRGFIGGFVMTAFRVLAGYLFNDLITDNVFVEALVLGLGAGLGYAVVHIFFEVLDFDIPDLSDMQRGFLSIFFLSSIFFVLQAAKFTEYPSLNDGILFYFGFLMVFSVITFLGVLCAIYPCILYIDVIFDDEVYTINRFIGFILLIVHSYFYWYYVTNFHIFCSGCSIWKFISFFILFIIIFDSFAFLLLHFLFKKDSS